MKTQKEFIRLNSCIYHAKIVFYFVVKFSVKELFGRVGSAERPEPSPEPDKLGTCIVRLQLSKGKTSQATGIWLSGKIRLRGQSLVTRIFEETGIVPT